MGKLYLVNYLSCLFNFRTKARISLLFVFLAGFYNASDAQPTPAANWEYSRIISLSSSTTMADYQVKITLLPGQYGGMNPDGSDLRFYDNTNNVCNYWIEKWNTSGTSVIWVKVPTNGASSLTMYYGNTGATAVSNGGSTFDFFDDFSGNSLKSNWTKNESGGTVTVSGSEVNLYNTGNRVAIASPFSPASSSFVLEVKHKETNYYRNRFYATDKSISSLNADSYTPTGWADYGYFNLTARESPTGSCYPAANGVSANTNYLTSWNITDGSTYTWSTFDYASGNHIYSKSQDVTAPVRNIVIAVTESSKSTTSVDWVRVRKSAGAAGLITVSVGDPVQLAPVISGFTPTAFCAGSSAIVTITGTNFSNAETVTIDGTNVASFTVDSRTQITAIASAGNTTGKISVTTSAGTVNTSTDINVNPLPIQYTIGGGGGYCEGGSGKAITLSGSQNGISYQLLRDASAVGSAIAGTGAPLTFPLQTVAGSYTVAAQDNTTGCPQNMTGTATIVINTVNKYDVTGTGNYCSGGPGLAVGLSKSDAGVNYQLLLAGSPVGSPVPGTGSAISFGNHTEGTYTVLATNTSTSCFETMNGSALIGTFTPPSGTLSSNDDDNKICFGGDITFTATSGYTNYNFKIDGASKQNGTSASFVNPALALGSRSVTVDVTSADGCVVTFNAVSVLVSNLPTATLSSNKNNICPGDPVTFTAGGGSSYIFYVNGIIARPSSPTNTYTIPSLNNGDMVTAGVTNVNGCTSVSPGITMVVKPLPAAAESITGTATVCQGQSGITYSVPAITNANSYTWTLPAGATIVSGAGTRSITVNYSTTAVTDNITVAGTNGCGNGVSKSLYVTVNPLPVDAGTISGNNTVCQGQNGVTYTVPAITHATGYMWTVPTGASIINGANTNSITVDFSNAAVSGNISVKGANTCGDGVGSSFPVTVNPLPAAAGNITGIATLCQGSSGIAYHVSAIAHATGYTWAYTGTGITINNETAKDITIDFADNATSGVLTVTGNNDCGVGTVSANYSITVNPLPTATIAVDANAEVCKNSTIKPGVTFTGTNGTAPYTFTYNIDGGANKTITTTSGSSITLSAPVNVSGTFTYNLVSVKDGTSTHCANPQSGSVIVTIDTLPVPVLIGPDQICPDQILDYSTQSGNSIHNYTWTITNGGKISGGTNTDHTVQVHWANNSSSKSIYVNYTDGNGCSGNTSVSVVSTSPTAPVITGPKTVCLNATEVVYETQAGYTDYNWNITGGTITSGSTTNSVLVTWNESGSKTISVNFNSGLCSAPAPTTYPVTVNPLPTATVATNNASVCQNGGSPVITFTGANGAAPYTFSYSINGTVQTDVISSGNSKTITVQTTTPGEYIYKLISVKGNNTCAQEQTDEVKVTVNTLPTASISSAVIVCQNSTQPDITFTGSNGKAPYIFTYKINGGSDQTATTISGNSVTVPAATNNVGNFTYSITKVTDANGCPQTVTGQNAIVTVNALPTATISGPDSVCMNSAANITITGANGTAPYIFVYNIDGGANLSATSSGNNAVIPVTTSAAGSFEFKLVSVQEANGNECIQAQSGSWTVVVSPATVGGTVGGSTSVCKGGNGSLNLTGQTGKIIGWQSSTDGSTWNDINNTTATFNYTGLMTTTQYRAIVKSGFCGIGYSTAATVTVNEAIGGTLSGSTTLCAGGSGVLQLTGNTGSVIYWQSSIDSGTTWLIIPGITATHYSYTNIPKTTWYRVMSQNTPCNTIYSDIAKVIVNARPTAAISGNAAICDGGSATLTLNVTGAAPFSGTLSDGTTFNRSVAGTFNLIVSPNSSTAYTINTLTDANCSNNFSDKSGLAIINVNPVPVPPIIKPGNTTICEGGILPLTSVLNDVTNAAINTTHIANKSIPDNDWVTGASDAITVSGIPVGAIIDSVLVNFSITYPDVSDIKINLKAPNGKIITLVSNGISGENMTNTTISSDFSRYDLISTHAAPYTGVFRADGEGTSGAEIAGANTRSFAALFGTTATPPNGDWILKTYDTWEGDEGTFDNWNLKIYYHVPIQPVEIVWSPMTGLYSDPSATVPYTGNAVTTVYAKPATTTTYTGTSTSSETCTSSSEVTVTVKSAPLVTVTADYCSVPGFVQLTASSVPAATSYTWSTGGTGATTLVDEARLYLVSANVDGCVGTGFMSVAQELVTNGDFEAGYIPGSFATEYGYVKDNPNPAIQNELVQEGLFAIDTSANNLHYNFFGKDHTTSEQTGKFMIINGYPNATTKIIWEQTVNVLPNTNYYYSAWAMNLNNPVSQIYFPKLQFEVNGVPIGTIADLSIAPKPTNAGQVSIDNWVRFYYGNTTGWNSGSNTTAVIRIIDTNPALAGNDFGLDDISFATLSTFITRTSDPESDHQTLCKNSPIDKITYTVGSGGAGPAVSGLPKGVTSSFNGITLTISGNPDSVGVFTYTVVAQGNGSCAPATTTGTITVTGPTISKPLDAGTDAQSVCINTPAAAIKYNYGGTATDAEVQGLPAGMSFSKNLASKLITIYGTPSEPGLFTYSVLTTQGTCGYDTITGTVNVTIQTINKTPESDTAQVICKGSGITSILYEIKGTGTGATVTGLPSGVSGSYNPGTGIYTISGTPTVASGTYTYTVTTTGSCSAAAAKGTIEIMPDATIHLTSAAGTDNQKLCFNSGSIALISYQVGVATGATVSGLPNGLTHSYSNGIFKITGTPTETGTFTYTVQTTGTCVQTSITGNIKIDPEVSGGNLTSSYTATCAPASGTITLSGETGTILGWESSVNGTSWSAISNTSHSYDFTVNNTTYFRAKIDGASCGTSLSNAVLVGVHNLWTGTTSSDWNDGTNWSDGNVPTTSCPAVIIPGGTAHQPTLASGSATIDNLEIQNGAVLTVNNNAAIKIAGTIANSGTFDVKDGTIEFNGSSAQSISGGTFKNNALNNLVVSNSSAAGVTITNTLDIYRSVTFGVNGKKLTTGGYLTLKSTAIETAWLGNMTGKTLEGDVTVERYINVGEGAGYHGKSWQLVATPTTGQSVWQSWMENGNKTSTGYGTQITGQGDIAKGFDAYSSTPSLKYYDYNSNNWIGIDNTGVPVFNKKGYLIFIRGDRSKVFPAVGNTTLRTMGRLFTPANPPASTQVVADKYESVGNPYASAIDMNRILISGGVAKIFIVWDPKLSSSLGLGAYQTLAQTQLALGDNNFYATPGGGSYGSGANNFIQSGQAFFAQATGAGGTVSFNENSKAGGSKLLLRGDNSSAMAGKFGQIQATLYGINNDGSSFVADGNLVQYNDGFTNKIDALDARKLTNSAENFGILSVGKNLVIERRKEVAESDTIHYNLAGIQNQNYRLQFAAKGLSSYGYQGYIEDTYLNTSTPLSLEGTTEVNFAVTNVAGSKSVSRFRIVFKMLAPLPVTFVSVRAQQKEADIVVNWKVENEKDMLQYDIEKSSDGVRFVKSGTVTANNSGQTSYQWTDQKVAAGYNYYRIKSANRDGKIEYSTIVKVLVADSKSSINIYPNPITDGVIHLQLGNQPEGMYGIRLLSPLGQVIVAKQVSHAGGNGTQNIKWDYNLAHGVYQLEVTKPNGDVAVIKVMY